MNSGDEFVTEHHDQQFEAGDSSQSHPPVYPQSYRRRPIVVRDPKTGRTRIVGARNVVGGSGETGVGLDGGGAGSASSGYETIGSRDVAGSAIERHATMGEPNLFAEGAPVRYRCGNEGISADVPDRLPRQSEGTGFNDGRAPIMRIVSGYRGKQIVVRDPSRRVDGLHTNAKTLGVRGGVRKVSYIDRRAATRTSPCAGGFDDHVRFERESDDGRQFHDAVGHEVTYGSRKQVGHQRQEGYDTRFEQREGFERFGRRGRENIAFKTTDKEGSSTAERVVYVDNLSDDVTTTGLADLFGMVGAVKELRLLYDRQGRPNGSADIVFQRRADATEAVKSLHNVPLNNRPMHLSTQF